ncbi:hypothetical protein FQN52_008305 [Onygenales sp. PD_12]|nr:hypothetical protein FQN53_000914 [Emmonsiellopsis sp. PD_33]KAK2785755.1 hypothetical protein FQN52_008305 [Onygenales sp. PD_12]
MPLDLEKQFTFYGAYHHNPVNIAIHITCVPIIMLCMFQLATLTGPLLPLPPSLTLPSLPPNLGTLAATLYALLYILMEPVAGTLLSPFLLGGAMLANHLTTTYGRTATHYGLAIQVAAWILQFVGHGKFEGRAPALLDNLVQAFFLAPFFVWLEVLFGLGYRPQLKRRIDERVQVEISKFQEEKKKTK